MRKLKSFTLVELLVVISIIGIISTFVVISFNQSRVKARDNKRISDANLLASALGQYYTSNLRSYPVDPASSGGNSVLSATTDQTWFKQALRSYISPVPADPNDLYAYYYVYSADGRKAAIVVLGLESGTAKCNITSPGSSPPDLVSSFESSHSGACYYVSL